MRVGALMLSAACASRPARSSVPLRATSGTAFTRKGQRVRGQPPGRRSLDSRTESAGGPAVMVLGVYQAVVDARAAEWVVAGLRGFAESVLSLLPGCFSGYLRVFHPADRRAGSDRLAVALGADRQCERHAHARGVQLGPSPATSGMSGRASRASSISRQRLETSSGAAGIPASPVASRCARSASASPTGMPGSAPPTHQQSCDLRATTRA